MTCIVAVSDGNNVWMGGDSCGSNGHSHGVYYQNKKVCINGDFLIGFTGSYRTIDLLTYVLSVKKPRIDQDPENYIRTDFVNEVFRVFNDNKAVKIDNNVADLDSCFLIGYKGKIYKLQGDFSVLNDTGIGLAIGCGYLPALGSLHTTYEINNEDDVTRKPLFSPHERVHRALLAAEHNVIGVKQPFEILKL